MYVVIIANRSYLGGPFSARLPSLLPHGIPGKSSSQLNRFLSAGPLSPGASTRTRPDGAEEAPGLSVCPRRPSAMCARPSSAGSSQGMTKTDAGCWQFFFLPLLLFSYLRRQLCYFNSRLTKRCAVSTLTISTRSVPCAQSQPVIPPLRAGSQLTIIRRLT